VDVTSSVVEPFSCRWCDIPQRRHGRQHTAPAGWHTFERPTDAQILARMRARRAARTARPPYEARDTLRTAVDRALASLPRSLGIPLARWLLVTGTSAIATETDLDPHALAVARGLLVATRDDTLTGWSAADRRPNPAGI
jgi:hypothetical protein